MTASWRWLMPGLLALAAASAEAQPLPPVAAEGVLQEPEAAARLLHRLAARATDRINVRDFGAKGDLTGYDDATMVPGSRALASTAARFTQEDVGKAICNHGSGASGAEQCGVITSVGDAHHVTVSFTAVLATPYHTMAFATVAAPGTGYAPGEIITLANNGPEPARLAVATTQVAAAAVANAGSGGSDGMCTLAGTSGSTLGGAFTAIGRVTGGALTGRIGIVNAGHYTANPPRIADEPVTSGCGLVGASVALTMGVQDLAYPTYGNTVAPPPNPLTQASATGTGSGAALIVRWTRTGGAFFYGTDDSAAFVRAIELSNSRAGTGTQPCIAVPGGSYQIGHDLPEFVGGGCILGDERWHSTIQLGPAASHLFRWSEAWIAPSSGNPLAKGNSTATFSQIRLGPVVRDIALVGDRASTHTQAALEFDDRNDFAAVSNVDISHFSAAIRAGFMRAQKAAYLRESAFDHVRVWYSGAAGTPAVEFRSETSLSPCTGVDATNEVDIDSLSIYGMYGPGLVIRNGNACTPLRSMRLRDLRIEGAEYNPFNIHGGADLMTVGDVAMAGQVALVTIENGEWISPYLNGAAVHLLAPEATGTRTAPSHIVIRDGIIARGANPGEGLRIDSGNDISAEFTSLTSVGGNVIVGPAARVRGPIVVAGNDRAGWTMAVHPTSAAAMRDGVVGYTSDSARPGVLCWAGGTSAANGEPRTCTTLLRGSLDTAGSVQLTSDGAAASSANILNLTADNLRAVIGCRVAVADAVTGDAAEFALDNALLRRKAGAGSLLLNGGTAPVRLTPGVAEGRLDGVLSVQAAPDRLHGGLALTVAQTGALSLRASARCTADESG